MASGIADNGAARELKVSRIVLAVLFTVYFFSSVDRALFGILAQPVKEELLLADWQIGFLTGFAFSLLHLTFGLVVARLADQRNRVTILSICITLWSIMTAMCGLAVNFIQLCLFRMGVGVGEAACLPASHSLITDYFPPGTRTQGVGHLWPGLSFGWAVRHGDRGSHPGSLGLAERFLCRRVAGRGCGVADLEVGRGTHPRAVRRRQWG